MHSDRDVSGGGEHAQRRAEHELALTKRLVCGITRLHARFFDGDPLHGVLDEVVALAIDVTGSARGFVGEVRRGDDTRVDVRAMHATDWSDDERERHRQRLASGGGASAFESLWRAVLREREPVFGAEPPIASRAPDEDGFELRSYLGVPIRRHGTLVGVIGVVNRPGGYDESWALRLDPLVAATGALFEAAHQAKERVHMEAELRRSEALLREAQELAGLGAYNYTLPDGRVCWTKQLRAMFELPSDVLSLPLAAWCALAIDEHQPALHELFENVMKDGVQRELEVSFRIAGVARHVQLVARGAL